LTAYIKLVLAVVVSLLMLIVLTFYASTRAWIFGRPEGFALFQLVADWPLYANNGRSLPGGLDVVQKIRLALPGISSS
jgi:hypothetical protein